MTSTSEEQQGSTPENLTLTLAIAGRLDAQFKLLAQTLHNDKKIYYSFAILDSLNCSYSMFKYYFDVVVANNNNDAMHDMMMTPGGISAIYFETVFIVSFAFFACDYNSRDPDVVKQTIAEAWPYFRDVMKALKNAYKGFKSTAQLIHSLGGPDIKNLIMPIGLALGLVAVVNRLFMRYMLEQRKTYMDINTKIIQEILENPKIIRDNYSFYEGKIKAQSMAERIFSLGGATLGGLIDSLYLYVGVISVAALSFPLLIAVASFCIFYSISCVTTRIYEEYDYQLKLLITHSKIRLALITKELQTTYQDLLNQVNGSVKADRAEKTRLNKSDIFNLITEFEEARNKIHSQTNNSYFTAILQGVKHGIYAYSALSSCVFFIAAILSLSSVAFPPTLILSFMVVGATLMFGFVIHSLVAHSRHVNKDKTIPDPVEEKFQALKAQINLIGEHHQEFDIKPISSETFNGVINQKLNIDSSPKYLIPEWFEVTRSSFSGLAKGQKSVDFVFNFLQEKDAEGHYHDSPLMLGLGAISAIVYGSVLSLRALAKGIGKDPLGQVNMADAMNKIENSKQATPPPANMNQPAPAAIVETPVSKDKKAIQKHQQKGMGFFSSPSNYDLTSNAHIADTLTFRKSYGSKCGMRRSKSLENLNKTPTSVYATATNRKSMDLFFPGHPKPYETHSCDNISGLTLE